MHLSQSLSMRNTLGPTWLWLLPLVIAFASPRLLAAQHAKAGVVQVAVDEAMEMVSGLLVRAGGQSARTDAQGSSRLTLPVGEHAISITHIGYRPTQIPVTVVADSVVMVRVKVEMVGTEMEVVRVSATRMRTRRARTHTHTVDSLSSSLSSLFVTVLSRAILKPWNPVACASQGSPYTTMRL